VRHDCAWLSEYEDDAENNVIPTPFASEARGRDQAGTQATSTRGCGLGGPRPLQRQALLVRRRAPGPGLVPRAPWRALAAPGWRW